MNTKERSILETYKYHITLIITLIFLITSAVITLVFININGNYKDSMLVNVLGRQRMLTQMMAKDTGRIHTLNTLIESGEYNEQKILELKADKVQSIEELKYAIQTYKNQVNNVKHGYVIVDNKFIAFTKAISRLNDSISKHEDIWRDFEKACNIIIKEDKSSSEFIQAVRFVNENNNKLLDYSEEITNIVLKYNKDRSFTLYYIVLSLIIVMLISLVVFIIDAYKHLFIPIGQLHKGMTKLGISKEKLTSLVDEKDLAIEFSEVKIVFAQLKKLILLIENLNKNIPFKDILKYIFDAFSDYIPYTHIGVALISDDKKFIKASYGITSKQHEGIINSLSGLEMSLHGTSLKNIIETGETRIINDLEAYVSGKPVKEYNQWLLRWGIKASITLPLRSNNEVIGVIFFSSDTKNIYNEEHAAFLRTLANSMELSLEKNIIMEELVISSTMALAKLTEERDLDTGEHLGRMSRYSKMLAELLSKEDKYRNIIDAEYIKDIERFSPLHDIGKVAIRDEILLKPGKLTPEEFQIMKTHASYGGKVLRLAEENINKKGRSIFRLAIEIAEGHHEKWDGSGYPYGKKGEEIPISARIVALADVLDALTSKRPYKEPFTFEQSVDIIKEGAGKHFDPELIKVFIDNLDFVKQTYLALQANEK
jgi:response regulator RpfG family c-di-GMP phosphodiesterase